MILLLRLHILTWWPATAGVSLNPILHLDTPETLTCDGVIHVGERLAGEAAALPERVPKLAAIPRMQKIDVRLADGDVGRRCVGVQLLMPLLQEMVLYSLRNPQMRQL